MDALLKSFISLFVAIDALGSLPVLVSLTKGMESHSRRHLVAKASLAAYVIGLLFLLGGNSIFVFLGILEGDFRIAGGLLLIVFAIRDVMVTSSHQGTPLPVSVGIVPIALPLIMGPAALASVILSAKQYGMLITIGSFSVNLLFVWLLFSQADRVHRRLGDDLSDAIAKISALLLAAIGVMLVRSGVYMVMLPH